MATASGRRHDKPEEPNRTSCCESGATFALMGRRHLRRPGRRLRRRRHGRLRIAKRIFARASRPAQALYSRRGGGLLTTPSDIARSMLHDARAFLDEATVAGRPLTPHARLMIRGVVWTWSPHVPRCFLCRWPCCHFPFAEPQVHLVLLTLSTPSCLAPFSCCIPFSSDRLSSRKMSSTLLEKSAKGEHVVMFAYPAMGQWALFCSLESPVRALTHTSGRGSMIPLLSLAESLHERGCRITFVTSKEGADDLVKLWPVKKGQVTQPEGLGMRLIGVGAGTDRRGKNTTEQ